jgi:hypothetical protein
MGPEKPLVNSRVPTVETLIPIWARGIGAGPATTLAPLAGSKMLLWQKHSVNEAAGAAGFLTQETVQARWVQMAL